MSVSPVFFPFSHLGQRDIETLEVFFPSITHLPMSRDFNDAPALAAKVDAGVLTPVFPDAARMAEVERQVASFLDWADLNRGNERNLKALLKETPYFCDDTQLAQIQSQIRQGVGPGISASDDQTQGSPSPLLFLKLAQNLDAQDEKIQGELDSLAQSQQSLFAQLKGELELSETDAAPADKHDPGLTLTRERIQAWAAWFKASDARSAMAGSPLLVTTSAAVYNHLIQGADQVINTLDIESIKVHENGCDLTHEWQGHFVERLQKYIEAGSSVDLSLPEAQDGCRCMGGIQLGLFADRILEEALGQPGRPLAVCRVVLK